MAKKRRKSGSKRNKNYGVVRPIEIVAKEYQKRKCHCHCRHQPSCAYCHDGRHRYWTGERKQFACSGIASVLWNRKAVDVLESEPNMPTLNELVDIGIGRQVHKALADSNNVDEFDRRIRPLMITESTSARQRWFHDQYKRVPTRINVNCPIHGNLSPANTNRCICSYGETESIAKPPEVPTYPAAHSRKMRIKP